MPSECCKNKLGCGLGLFRRFLAADFCSAPERLVRPLPLGRSRAFHSASPTPSLFPPPCRWVLSAQGSPDWLAPIRSRHEAFEPPSTRQRLEQAAAAGRCVVSFPVKWRNAAAS